MTRIILTFILPLIAPTIAFVVWTIYRARRHQALATGQPIPAWQEYPWIWLVGSGAVLAIVSVFTLGAIKDGGTTSSYTPARYEDGKLIPGEFVDQEPASQ